MSTVFNSTGLFGVLQAAARYTSLQYPVFPCDAKKSPLTKRGFHDASTDYHQLRAWFEGRDDLNVAIAVPQGVIVLDIDKHRGGQEALEQLFPDGLPHGTPIARTPRGGIHLWFRCDQRWADEFGIGANVDVLEGVDIRGCGKGYVLVEPSKTADGEYRWEAPLVPPTQLPELPEHTRQVIEQALSRTNKTKRNGTGELKEPTPRDLTDEEADGLVSTVTEFWTPGERHRLTMAIAGVLRKLGVPKATTEQVIARIAVGAGDDELSDRLRTVENTYAIPLEETLAWSGLPEELAGRIRCIVQRPFSQARVHPDHWAILKALAEQYSVTDARLNTATNTVEVQRNGRWLKLDDPLLAELSFVTRLAFNKKGELVEVPVGKEKVHDALLGYARYNQYDPIADLLENLPPWDGLDWIRMLANHITHRMPPLPDGSDPVELFLRKWLVGAVAKALDGKQNYTLVLVGKQGIGKSTFARWLAPDQDLFTDSPLDPDTRETVVMAARTLVWELNELGSTTRRKDVDALKRFLSASETSIRLPYARQVSVFRHRASFIATSNDAADLLRDSTGNRRFVTLCIEGVDWGYRTLDVLQLWSQAVELYRQGYDFTLSADEAGWRDTANARVESVRNSVTADVLLEVLTEILEAAEYDELGFTSYNTLYYPAPEQDWSPHPSDKQTSQLGPLKAAVRDGTVIIHARNLYDFIADCVREKPEVVASQVRRLIGRFASPDTKPHRVEGVQFKAFSLSLDQVKELVQYIAGGSPES